MKRFLSVILFCTLFCSTGFGALSFVRSPTITAGSGSTWTIDFEISEAADVEVAVVDLKDSSIVRHLAAGVLGVNPPAPLQGTALRQTLAWDGKDDLGFLVADTDSISVRVRAGMSVNLERFVGGNPYAFRDENSGYWSFNGMSKGDNGEVYVSGSSEPQQFACIRAYNSSGVYVRTVFPFRGDFQAAQVSGFGVNNWLNGTYSPRFAALHGPTLTNTILSSFNGYSMLPINGPGEVAVGGGKGLTCLKFNSNGSIQNGAAQVGLVTSPALPNHYAVFGPIYLNLSHRTDRIYLSGYHHAAVIDAGCHFVLAADTGFWRDGCVYRIDMTTGVAAQFLALDSVPLSGQPRDLALGGPSDFFTAIHSVKADAQGRVFVCDRVHQEIGVYDSTGIKLGAIPGVANPDQIALDPATGAVYVACRSGWHYDAKPLYLKKYSGWGASDSLVFSANLWLNYGESGVHLIIQQGSDNKPMVWIANGDVGVRIYRDEGDTVTLFKDFYATKVNNLGFDRIGVDRRTETVYINNGDPHIYKITDWSDPVLVRCSTSTNQKLLASDFCISYDNQLYTRGGAGFSGPIERWTLDPRHAPIPFPNTGTNAMCPQVYGRMGVMYGDKGLAVSPLDKHVTFMQMHNFARYWVDTLEPGGTLDTVTWTGGPEWMPRTIIDVNTGGMGCVKFDLQGNLYVGSTIRPAGHRVEAAFAADFLYPRGAGGAVAKYAPGDTGTLNSSTGTASNSMTVYKSNLGPMSGHGACQCRSSRFDVDPYGRLFIPSGVTQKVAVVDNNDNPILEFGRYGNWDETGGGTDVPMACPLAAAASDNYIYVNDLINTRLVRLKMNYVLDNIPGIKKLAAEMNAGVPGALSLSVSPNPFRPVSRVSVRLPERAQVKLAVYDVGGRLVRTLKSGEMKAGVHHLAWNAADAQGRPVSAGIYVVRLTAGTRTLISKVILAK